MSHFFGNVAQLVPTGHSHGFPAPLYIEYLISVAIDGPLFQRVQAGVQFQPRPRSNIGPDNLVRVPQVRYVFFLGVLPRDPNHVVAREQQVGHLYTGRGEEPVHLLRVGYHFGLGPVIRLGKLDP